MTPTPISKPSRPASTTCAANTIRAAGRPATTFRPCATDASSRRRLSTVCPSPPPTSSSIRGGRFSADLPRAASDHAAVRCRMDQSQFLLRPLSAQRELFRRLGSVRLSSRGGRARARAACAFSRRGTPRRARRHLVAAGRATAPAATAKACAQALALLGAAGYEFKGTTLRERGSGRPFQFRDHGHEPRRRAAGARLRQQSRPRRHRCAGAPRRCRAIRPAADRRSTST